MTVWQACGRCGGAGTTTVGTSQGNKTKTCDLCNGRGGKEV